MKQVLTLSAAAVVFALLGTPLSQAASYQTVLTWEDVKGTGGSRVLYGTVLDGTTAYNFLALEDASFPGDVARITKVTDVAGAKTYSEFVSTLDWLTASGSTSLTGWYGAGLVTVGPDKFLQFADTATDALWRVNLADASISPYVSATTIMALTGEDSVQVLSPSTPGANADHYFYEGRSDSILRTNGAGVVETYVSNAQLNAVTGNDSVSGGITFDGAGDLYWASNSSDAMYKWDGAAGSEVLNAASIGALTGETSAGFGDIFYAPNGRVYFYETAADSILSFDPADPAGSLAWELTEAELTSGPAGTDSVGQFEWYNGNIAWTPITPSAPERGFFAVPEPMTLTLLGLALPMVRRRR